MRKGSGTADRPPARIQKAKRSLVKRLSGKPGLVGVGVALRSSGNYEIVVMVVKNASSVLADVPRRWEGVPVRTQIGGTPRKF